MLYNIAIKSRDQTGTQIAIGIDENSLGKFIIAYNEGRNAITVNGEKLNLYEPTLVKIFDVSKRIKADSTTHVKFEMQKWANIIDRGEFSVDTLEAYGEDVTSTYITGGWGESTIARGKAILNSIYVSEKRMSELKAIRSKSWDLTKLIKLCEELNECYSGQLYFATGALVRSTMDHVPPIFGMKSFNEVANNYNSQGRSASFKESMEHLNKSMRKISDKIVHSQITSSETLPNETQVDCKRDLDVLLEEIVRILK